MLDLKEYQARLIDFNGESFTARVKAPTRDDAEAHFEADNPEAVVLMVQRAPEMGVRL